MIKFLDIPRGISRLRRKLIRFAYIEFAEPSLVPNALLLNESTLHGRSIKVTTKRTNIPFMNRGRGRGLRGGFRGSRGRGGYRGGFRGRGRGGYTPY